MSSPANPFAVLAPARFAPDLRWHSRRSPGRRVGFTLIELIVSILLMAALLTATWTMLNSFRDRFEKSQTRVERSQLIRAVHQVFENDLASCLVTRSRRPQSSQSPAGGLFAPLSRDRLQESVRQRSGDPTSGNDAGDFGRSLGDRDASVALGPAEGRRSQADASSQNGLPGDTATSPSLSIDGASDAAALEAAEQEGDGQTRNASLGLQSETDRVAQNEWLAQDTRFYGTSTALVCDLVVPAEMPENSSPAPGLKTDVGTLGPESPGAGMQSRSMSSGPFSSASPSASAFTLGSRSDMTMSGGSSPGFAGNAETAEIPEVTRRVVYLFTDPDTGTRAGRPAGLVRCELTNRQMASLRVTASDRMDLFAILQPILGGGLPANDRLAADPALAGASADGRAPAGDANGLNPLNAQASTQDPLARPATDASMPLGQPAAMPTAGASMQADLLTEIISFRLRYYDGESWHGSWDSRERRELPVAVEMRFRLSDPATDSAKNSDPNAGTSLESLDSTDASGDAQGDASAAEASRLESMAGEPEMSDDSRLMSAQTRPVEDHRYVVLLSSPPMLRTTDRSESQGGSDESLTTERGSGREGESTSDVPDVSDARREVTP